MQAWWRVLRGVWPYKKLVIISVLCALGVGLSYASGVAVMLPVLKVFISAEGIHGWANRTAAEDRLHLTFWDLDQTIQGNKHGLVIQSANQKKGANPDLDPTGYAYKLVTDVTNTGTGDHADKSDWGAMMKLLARADAGSKFNFTVQPETDEKQA